MSLFSGRSARILRFRGKTHESQTEVHLESTNSLNVCPVVEDQMDEENLDDREEQSEEREEHERAHSVSKLVQAREVHKGVRR